jgi:hypothetical protein
MNSVIDPNVDVVWNAVKTVIDHGKPDRTRPCQRRGMGGGAPQRADRQRRRQPPDDARSRGRATRAGSLSPGIELAPDQVRALIDKSPSGWNQFARALQDSLQPAIAAIDKKDPQALFEAGDKIDEVCESCHQVFWYPSPGIGSAHRLRLADAHRRS